jgi:hypothetical protein
LAPFGGGRAILAAVSLSSLFGQAAIREEKPALPVDGINLHANPGNSEGNDFR